MVVGAVRVPLWVGVRVVAAVRVAAVVRMAAAVQAVVRVVVRVAVVVAVRVVVRVAVAVAERLVRPVPRLFEGGALATAWCRRGARVRAARQHQVRIACQHRACCCPRLWQVALAQAEAQAR